MDRVLRSLGTEQPSGDGATDPPDDATGGYADYVERLEQQIAAGRDPPDDERDAVAVAGSARGSPT